VKRFLRLLLLLLALGLVFGVYVVAGLPPREAVVVLDRKNPETTGVMRQRDEEARRAKRKLRREQVWVPLFRISRHLVHAVVAAEDPKFFGHEGVDWDAVKESAETNWRKRSFARGGSTITQQLAKNLFFSTRKDVTRKLREFVVARWLEEDLSKKRILEIYLNVIEWGDGVYGCEAAAGRYYGKAAADLNESEAAGLAAMIPSPRRINPRTNPASHARAQRRVLWLMARAGYVKRDVGGLGSEPPPEPVEEEGAEPAEPDAVLPPSPSPEPVPPSEAPTPAPSESPPSTEPTPNSSASDASGQHEVRYRSLIARTLSSAARRGTCCSAAPTVSWGRGAASGGPMQHRCPRCGTALPQGVPAWVRHLTVGQVMTPDPVTLGPEDTLMRAVEVMRMKRVRRLPIVIGETRVGLLAEGDLKRAQPPTLSDSQDEFNRVMEGTTVSRIMIGKPITVTDDAPVLEAATILHDTKYGGLPVLRAGRLVGIITDHDLLGTFVELMNQGG